MLQDLRLGARLFRRHFIVAAAAVLSLAVGIGANTAIFSVLHNVVLRPLPFDDPQRLMMVWETNAEYKERWVAPANFVDWRRETTSFAALAAFDSYSATLTGSGEPQRLRALGVSGTFFPTLGASAALGRTLLPSDDAADAADVAVLSHGLWSRLFAQSTSVLEETLLLDGRRYQIVGVMPQGFESPVLTGIELWLNGDRGVPRSFPFGGDLTAVRDSHTIYVLGRLASGATRESAQHEFTQLMETLARRHPDTNTGLGVNVVPLQEQIVGAVRPVLSLLQVAVGVMLLIACANVAHLLLGQAASRQNEMQMRLALGAGRTRLTRQLIAESLVVAIPGGILGVALAEWTLRVLIAFAPQALPRVGEIELNATVMMFAVAVTTATAVLFGLAPSVQLSRQITQGHGGVRVTGARHTRRWHRAIVVTELALAQVLLVGAGLLLASFIAAQRVELGFSLEGRVAAELSLAPERYLRPAAGGGNSFTSDATPKRQFVDAVIARGQQTPGVRAIAASFTSPLTGAPNRGIRLSGRPDRGAAAQDTADFQLVTPDYFRAIGAPVRKGRAILASDTATSAPVAVINEAFARTYFPGEDPIGREVMFGERAAHQIVGVVADMRYRDVEETADPTFYLPITQNSERWPFLSFTIWTDAGVSGAAILREAIRSADPLQAITRIRSYDEILSSALAPRRFNTMLVLAFAVTALLLAAIGVYGVMAYTVSTRTREIGVRAALGASPGALMKMMIGEGAKLAGTAIVMGAVAGVAATRLLSAMLFEVTSRDPVTFSVVAALLGVIALTACWLPARRAIRVNPIAALRE